MALLDKNWLALSGDEKVVNSTHPSWYKFSKDILFVIGLFIFGIYTLYVTHFGSLDLSPQFQQLAKYLSYIFIGSSVLFLLLAVYKRHKIYYVVTTDNFIRKTKLINKDPDYIPIEQIQMSRVRQKNYGIDELLGYGHITISTAATAGEEVRVDFVPEPYEFKRSIELAEKGVKPEYIIQIVKEDLTLDELETKVGEEMYLEE